VQRHAGAHQQLAAAGEIQYVVRVTAVGGAATHRDQATVAQLAQVIGDQALAPVRQVAQLADAPVAARQLAQQPPPQRVPRQPQEPRRGALVSARAGDHSADNTSISFDASPVSRATGRQCETMEIDKSSGRSFDNHYWPAVYLVG
jgi:hypothetical protein